MAESADLAGRTALVTGGGSGLGRRFAIALSNAGAAVAVAGRNVQRLEATATEIVESGGRAIALPIDIMDAGVIEESVASVEERLGLISILVNNAGVPDAQRAHKMSVDLVDRVISTNLRGPFLLSCEVARRLISTSTPGAIVNLSSMGAYHYYEGMSAALYSTTKAAINRMTETLAVEWAKYGINVNAIAPGTFRTEMLEGMLERLGGDIVSTMPRKRLGEPEQLDSTLLYLVSPRSEMVTGTIIKVDDGGLPR
jgi:NAD(P)-dependent dehydrogenase (short-subunit alcohol dehydrogenase family)